MRMQITFKSGAQIEVDAGEWTTARNQFTNELTRMDWTTPDAWTAKLHTIDLSQVAAVVALRTPEEASVDGE
jgi:hypothetical protein